MEIRIIITDAGGAGSDKSIQIGEHAGSSAVAPSTGGGASSAGVSASGADAPQGAAAAQLSAGGMSAGAAPVMGAFYQPGAPQPFVAQRAANVMPQSSSGVMAADESGGAAPGSGAGMATSTGEVQHG